MNPSYREEYRAAVRDAGLPDSFAADETADRFARLTERLSEYGKRFNLTAITEPREVLLKHVIDSLMAAGALAALSPAPGDTLLDVGAGAGFPSLPIATVLPMLAVTALDATAKKCRYIEETAAELGLSNITARNARAEEAAAADRESFSFVTARAVARFSTLCELCAPLLRTGGYLLAMKGPGGEKEAAEAAVALKLLGLDPPQITRYELPQGAGERTLLLCRKRKPTPALYPRPYAKMVKAPL